MSTRTDAEAPRFGPSDVGVGLLVVLAAVLIIAARTVSAAPSPPASALATPSHRTSAPAPVRSAQPFPGRVAGTTRQVVSVVAGNLASRTAILRLWTRRRTGPWLLAGGPVRVSLGSGGLTRVPSDARPQTPVGTWALGVVLTRDAHVTRMREHVLAPGDGWSSCLGCRDYDRLAHTGEMWTGRNGWSQVAIHIVTNPQRVRGRSSGVFLHVGDGGPTSGCIGAPLHTALTIAHWLDPAAAPRVVVAVRG